MSIRSFSPLLAIALGLALLAASPGTAAQAKPAASPQTAAKPLAEIKSVPELLRLADVARGKKDWVEYGRIMQRVLELRPYAGNIQLEISASHALRDDKTGGYNALMSLPDQGYGFAIEEDERLENLHGTQVWDYLVEKFGDNRKPVGAGRLFAALPKQDLLIESIAWDPAGKSLLVGSVRSGRISRVTADGKLVDFILPDATNQIGGVFDIAVDAPRKALWVATAQVPHASHADAAKYGDAALLKFELGSGKLLQRIEIPAEGSPRVPSALAVAPDGSVFAADSVQPVIWKIEGDNIRTVVRNPNLTGIRALSLNRNGSVLYIADHELGIFGLDLASGEAFHLTGPPQLTLYAIDALAWHDNQLIAVQNGFPPARVLRFALDDSGRRIVNSQVLDAAHAAFGIPGNIAVGGSDYYLIANSQKHLVDGNGKLIEPDALEGVRIFQSSLAEAMPQPRELPASLRGLPAPG